MRARLGWVAGLLGQPLQFLSFPYFRACVSVGTDELQCACYSMYPLQCTYSTGDQLHVLMCRPCLQVALCVGYVALQTDLEVLVMKLERTSGPAAQRSGDQKPQEHTLVPKDMLTGAEMDKNTGKQSSTTVQLYAW